MGCPAVHLRCLGWVRLSRIGECVAQGASNTYVPVYCMCRMCRVILVGQSASCRTVEYFLRAAKIIAVLVHLPLVHLHAPGPERVGPWHRRWSCVPQCAFGAVPPIHARRFIRPKGDPTPEPPGTRQKHRTHIRAQRRLGRGPCGVSICEFIVLCELARCLDLTTIVHNS
jgi:hypothetical protein